MKKYLFSILFLFFYYTANADQTFVSGADYSTVSFFDGPFVYVQEGASLSGNTINMNSPVYLYNSGNISGTINTNGNGLFVYNSGNMNGVIDAQGGYVVQGIRSESEITDVNVINGNYSVLVESFDNVELNNIKNIMAQSYIIKNSSVVMDSFDDWQNWTENVTLDENISLIINNANTVTSGTAINHVTNGATINVQIKDLDRMYKTQLKYNGSEMVLYIVRETKYSLIFEDSEENVLDLIREKHANDRLLFALDRADNIDEINRLKNLSYRFNHGILLRPLKVLNKFASTNLLKNENFSGVGIEPFCIVSDKVNAVGGRIYAGYNSSDLYFNMGVNLNRFDYSDDLNEFYGMSYGLNIKSKQMVDKFWIGESFGIALNGFTADYISSNNKIRSNPWGLSGYGDISVGYDFEIDKDMIFSPIVGFTYQQYKVADVSDTDSNFHVGADIKYFFITDGIKYEYSAYGSVGTNGDISANAKIGFVSVTDNAGVSFNVGMLKDDFDCYYRFSLDAKILF